MCIFYNIKNINLFFPNVESGGGAGVVTRGGLPPLATQRAERQETVSALLRTELGAEAVALELRERRVAERERALAAHQQSLAETSTEARGTLCGRLWVCSANHSCGTFSCGPVSLDGKPRGKPRKHGLPIAEKVTLLCGIAAWATCKHWFADSKRTCLEVAVTIWKWM